MNRFNFYAPVYDPFMKLFRLYRPGLITALLEPESDHAVLDIGGGTGFLAGRVAALAGRVVLLDSSRKMLDRALQYPGLELCESSAVEIPYDDCTFDSVMCIDALHHIRGIEKAAAEMQRVLKPGGKVVILEFDTRGFLGKAFWLFEKIYIDNSHFVTPEELHKLFSGFFIHGSTTKVSKIQYIYRGFKNDNR